MATHPVHDDLVRLWRSAHPHVLRPLRHNCSDGRCTVVRIRGFSCQSCGATSLHRTCSKCQEVQNSYICLQTGFDHLCGPHCRATSRNGRCCVSKQPVSSAVLPSARKTMHSARNRMRAAKVDDIAQPIVHALLFSRRRVQFELHRRKQLRVSAERAVHRYKRNCVQLKQPAVFLTMQLTYMSRYARTKSLAHLSLPEARKRAICMLYAELVHKLILTLQLDRNAFKIDAVACVLLYMLRHGVSVRDEEIIQQDTWLAEALVDAHAINTVLRCPIAYTATKNALNSTLRTLQPPQIERLRLIFSEQWTKTGDPRHRPTTRATV